MIFFNPLFISNPSNYQMALTFGDHTIDIKSNNFGSLSFLFRQILVKAI
jgi:hypothetical protein